MCLKEGTRSTRWPSRCTCGWTRQELGRRRHQWKPTLRLLDSSSSPSRTEPPRARWTGAPGSFQSQFNSDHFSELQLFFNWTEQHLKEVAENVSDEMLVLSESLLRRIWEVALALKTAEEEDGEHRSVRKIFLFGQDCWGLSSNLWNISLVFLSSWWLTRLK